MDKYETWFEISKSVHYQVIHEVTGAIFGTMCIIITDQVVASKKSSIAQATEQHAHKDNFTLTSISQLVLDCTRLMMQKIFYVDGYPSDHCTSSLLHRLSLS